MNGQGSFGASAMLYAVPEGDPEQCQWEPYPALKEGSHNEHMEMFSELLVEYGERSKDNDWDIGYGECDFPIEEMVSICEEWMQEFCDQMPLESQRKKYQKVFEID
ncbi:hypothetical protein ACTNEQ_06475 [Blautia obeum]|uniref:hypothetical protein n=1 Tax=Blautia obeum TaxID=40520 RepID=UPI003F88FCEA